MKTIAILVTACITFQLTCQQGKAQHVTDKDSALYARDYVVKLTKVKTAKVHYIKVGKKASVRTPGKITKGIVTEISPGFIVVGNDSVALNDILSLRAKIPEMTAAGIGSIILGAGSLAAGTLIGYSIMASTEEILTLMIAYIVGPTIIIGGAILGTALIVSGVAIFVSGKKFDVKKKWKIEVVPNPKIPG